MAQNTARKHAGALVLQRAGGVWSKNSCGFTRVVFQQSPEPFTTLKWACTLCVLVDHRQEQHVALALMMPLVMKMRHILRQRMTE